MARPPLASERLSMLPDGRLAYQFKRPWRDGTRVICTPLEFIEKLVPLVPKPRVHLTRYSGVLAPVAKWRPAAKIVRFPRLNSSVSTSRTRDTYPHRAN
jgi:hypothetical protein